MMQELKVHFDGDVLQQNGLHLYMVTHNESLRFGYTHTVHVFKVGSDLMWIK